MRKARSPFLLAATVAALTLALVGCEPTGPTWKPVKTTGGGYVTGLSAAPTGGTIVARTDVGGAYRWDDAAARWKPLLDALPASFGLGDDGYSVDSLTVDPSDPQKLWAAVGRVRCCLSGAFAVLRSVDGGATWSNTGFASQAAAINGNLDLRWTGERLMVDPRNSERVYFGTRADGLWVYDSGTWTKRVDVPAGGGVASPIEREGYAVNPVGVSSVAMGNASVAGDPTRTKVVYATVWGTDAEAGGVYASSDGGVTFRKMAGSPRFVRQSKVSRFDGLLFLTGQSDVGAPSTVWRYTGTAWEDQRPCGTSACTTELSGLDIDNAGHVVAAARETKPPSINAPWPVYYCSYSASTTCSGRWTNIVGPTPNAAGWRATIPNGWATAAVRFGPHAAGSSANTLWLSHWFGTARAVQSGGAWSWSDATDGIEETVVHGVLGATSSSANPIVLSATADLDGFVHSDPETTPTVRFPAQGDVTQGGTQDATGLAVSTSGSPRTIYRVGVGQMSYPSNPPSTCTYPNPGGVSTDGGQTWQCFGGSSSAVGGRIAVAADDATRLVWLPQMAMPRTSTSRGSAWAILGAPSTSAVVTSSDDGNQPLAAARVANGNASDDDFFLYTPGIGFYRATTTGGALAFGRITGNGLPSGLSGKWPEVRYGLAADPARASVVLAGVCGTGTSDGVWLSTNRGAAFTRLTGLTCGQAVAIGPGIGSANATLYVLGRAGGSTPSLYWSTDDGASWQALPTDGLPQNKTIVTIDADPVVAGRVYVGTKGRGLFVAQVPGT